MSNTPEEKWHTFICHYIYDNDEWAFEIKAKDFDDAEARLYALRHYGRVGGIKVGEIPADPILMWLAKTVERVRRFFS